MEFDANEFVKSDALHEAVADADLEHIRLLLDGGADIEARDVAGQTPLFTAAIAKAGGNLNWSPETIGRIGDLLDACTAMPDFWKPWFMQTPVRNRDDRTEKNDPAVALLLLERGANVNAKDNRGRTPLDAAVKWRAGDTVKALLEFGANADEADNNGMTPLMKAAETRCLRIARLLLDHGADPHRHTPQGVTPLHFAVQGGRIDLVRLLLERGVGVNVRSLDGSSALTHAAMAGEPKMVKLLRRAGAKVGFLETVALGDLARARTMPMPPPEDRGPDWGQGVLVWAAGVRDTEVTRLLLERGVSAAPADRSRQSALMTATIREAPDLVETLLLAGADADFASRSGMKPLHWAAIRSLMEIAGLLLTHGADANGRGFRSLTPLAGAAMFDHAEMVDLLLAHGADVGKGDDSEASLPLALAASRGRTAMIRLLVRRGAAIDAVGPAGATALSLAIQWQRRAAAETLIELGARTENVPGVDTLPGMVERPKPDFAVMLDQLARDTKPMAESDTD